MEKNRRPAFIPLALFFLLVGCSLRSAQAVGTNSPAKKESTSVPAIVSAAGSTSAPAASVPPTGVRPLNLRNDGGARSLPEKILGASVEAMIEHILDDPRKMDAIQQTAPGVVRFPGGSQSNYYNWRSGLLDFAPQPNSSVYYKFWAGVAPKIARAFPGGVSMEQYQTFASRIKADVILVPNLETSTVSEQTAWFTQLAADHSLPKDIELGNEFYIAMGNDPNVIRKWPDEPASLAVMKQYEEALRPIAGSDAKFAIQSAGSSFYIPSGSASRFQQRLAAWDSALAWAEWFQAVTIHLYPDPGQIIQQAGHPDADTLFQLFMGRADSGVDHALETLAAKLPGKEIWITEWSPNGGNFADIFNNPDMVPPQMAPQLVAREVLAILRHPEVTRSLYFTLNADPNSVFHEYVADSSGTYQPMPVAVVLQWFDEAANDGSSFQRVEDTDSPPATGLGEFSDNFRPVEGGVFHSDTETTLILQNASAEPRSYDPTQAGAKPHPVRVELLVADNFTDTTHAAAHVQILDANAPVTIPPFSIIRMIWNNS